MASESIRNLICWFRLSIFKPGTKIQSDFCPRLIFFFILEKYLLYDGTSHYAVLDKRAIFLVDRENH
ncbi:hypothetical protein ACPTGD_04610 [Enterococcus faecalis]